jgi:perosamine synthetase
MTDLARPATARPIPLAQPNIGPLEIELVTRVLASDTLAMGPFTLEFEEGLAALADRRHAIAVSSGTSGLHMAVRGMGIGPGDEVVTTPFSFVASANCLLFEGATPVFADIEEETLGLDPSLAETAIGPATRALLPVDVFGNACRITELEGLARTRGLGLIEDSCEALGTRLDGRPLGSFGDVSVFAFYPNKQITTGEGGMVLTDDDELAARLRSMRNQGRDEDGTWLRHVQLGFNYRIDELSAALGVAQLRRREELKAGRDRVVAAYAHRLGGESWVTLPRPVPGADVDWFVYVLRLDPAVDRDRLIAQLAADGVPARP